MKTDDLISLERVLQMIEHGRHHLKALVKIGMMSDAKAEAMDEAYRLFAESLEECRHDMIIDTDVHARWIVYYGQLAFCDECSFKLPGNYKKSATGNIQLPKYCPDCGAKMDAKEGDR